MASIEKTCRVFLLSLFSEKHGVANNLHSADTEKCAPSRDDQVQVVHGLCGGTMPSHRKDQTLSKA